MSKPLTLTFHENLTSKQKAILRSRSDFLILKGPAGTSKTYIAMARGLIQLQKRLVEKIVIIRSAVELRKVGFLPGDSSEKLDVYTEPYIHLMNELSPKVNYKALVHQGTIEFPSTSWLRGCTFDNAYIIVDEFQNLSEHELETCATRVGENTQMVLCGDSDQSDLPSFEKDGHTRVLETLERMPDFEVHEFTVDDIVRSAFVKRYYQAKEGLFTLPTFLTDPVGERTEDLPETGT